MEGKVSWQSPSNIALIKYWGKYGRQLPRNPSISFTLSECHTTTSVDYSLGQEALTVHFEFEGKENPAFAERITKYLSSIVDLLPWLNETAFKIASSNSFPHSSGIASSASAFSALAMCLADINAQHQGSDLDYKLASHLSRLGSGSASRSVNNSVGIWGESAIPDTTNKYSIDYNEHVHPIYLNFHDDILIVSKAEKSVSSSAGHGLMDKSAFAEARYGLAKQRLQHLVEIMKTDDLSAFGQLVEDEALTLHGLMMCSEPSFVLLEPNSIRIINAIRAFRKSSGLPVYFTIDAGPNIHMLYPDHIKEEIKPWRDTILKQLCADNQIIEDYVGNGPKKIY